MTNFIITSYLLYGCGSVFLIVGLAISGFWEQLFHRILTEQLALTKGSQTEEIWSRNSVPIYFKVYMFNWSNPVQTLAGTETAHFDEIGPYTFRFTQFKSDIVWNDNETVSFDVDRLWSFIPEKSVGSLNDRITNVNAVAVAIGERYQQSFFLTNAVFSSMLYVIEKRLYVTRTVEELLFQGYEDEILDIGNLVKKRIGLHFGFLRYLPEKFGWYFKKNATEKNTFNMYTGTDDINKLGKTHSWNHKTRCDVYPGQCDEIRGSLGELWPKNVTKEDAISLFISDFCGSFDLYKVGTQNLFGTEGVRFAGTRKTFDNGNNVVKNRCYCKNGNCSAHASGIRDISECVHGPVFVSFPHFYLADKSYRAKISGMKPNPEKHSFSITMQKDSGILTEIFARLQINIFVKAFSAFGFFTGLPEMMVPTVWFEEYVELPDKLKNRLTLAFNLVPNMLSTFGFIFIILGTVLLNCGYIYTQLYVMSIDPAPISNTII